MMSANVTFLDGYANSIADKDDWIGFTRAIYNMVGRNAPAALILNRILYWHGKSKAGKTRLQVESDGKLWLAKTYDDWEEECCVNASTARKAIDRIEKLGIVETKIGKFKNKNALFIRVIAEKFNELYLSKMDTSPVQSGQVVPVQSGHSHIHESTKEQEVTTTSSATPDGVAVAPQNPEPPATNGKQPIHDKAKRSSEEWKTISAIVKELFFDNGTVDINHGAICDWLYMWHEPAATRANIEKFIKWYFGQGNTVLVRQCNRVKGTEFQGKFCFWFEKFLKEGTPKAPAPSSESPPPLPTLTAEDRLANLALLKRAQGVAS